MRLTLRNGGSSYVWFEDIEYASIATANFDPLAVYQASPTDATLSHMWTHLKSGFGIKNATEDAGYVYAITWSQFMDYVDSNRGILPASWTYAAIVPRRLDLAAGEWAVTPIAKVFADNDGSYASSITALNIGRIL
jgi:hypothetical protein